MAQRTKKSAGPFVLWDELMRDDAYKLRQAFNPNQAEYVARVEDTLDLGVQAEDAGTLPSIEDVGQNTTGTAPRRTIYVMLGVVLTVLGLAVSALTLNRKPSDAPAQTPPEAAPESVPATPPHNEMPAAAAPEITEPAPNAATMSTAPVASTETSEP